MFISPFVRPNLNARLTSRDAMTKVSYITVNIATKEYEHEYLFGLCAIVCLCVFYIGILAPLACCGL
jgi:hypothetical protein